MVNVLVGMSSYVVITLASFVVRKFLFNAVGADINGVNAVFLNVLSMLSLTELGFGTAIIFNLYRTLADDNRDQTAALMQLYSKIYKIVAAVVGGIGVCLLPFLTRFFKGDISGYQNGTFKGKELLILVFLLMLADTVVSYLFAYKRAIIIADQKGFRVQMVSTGANLALNAFQIVGLLLTGNYILFLIIKVAFRLIENLTVAHISNQMFPYIKASGKRKLDPVIRANIISNIKAVSLHYVGLYLINGTTSLLISMLISPVIAGFYAFYSLILTSMRSFLLQLTQGVTPSFGNMLAKTDRERSVTIFHKTLFVCFALMNFTGVGLLILINPVISVWFGPQCVLALPAVIVLVLDFYIVNLAEMLGSLRASAGMYRPDRWVQIILAGFNLAISYLLWRKIGLTGLFLGPMICHIIKEILVVPQIVYRNIFKTGPMQYYRRFFQYFISTVAFALTAMGIVSLLPSNGNLIFGLATKLAVVLVIPNGLLILLYHRTEEFRYCVDLGKTTFRKVFKRM